MKTMKNHTFRVFLVLLAILLAVLAAGCTGGELDTKPVTYDPIVNDSVQIAKDKDTLISLLNHDGEFTIEIAEDIYLDSPVAVYGTKRLTGDKSVIMELDAEQYQHMLEVRKGATLIIDGATIDGNGAGTCVKVTEDASMLMLSGLVTYGCPYGVEVLGKIDIQGGMISESFSTAVYIRANASGSMTAGQIVDNCYHGVKIEKAGYMSISKDAVLSNSGYSLVHNSGTCDITGGSLTDGGAYIAYNMGNLNVAYTGSDPEGKLEWQGASVHAISQGKTGNLQVNGLSVRDTGWHGISSTPGTATMTLKNVSVSDVAQAAFYLRSDAVLENIQVADVGTAGVYIGNGSTVDIKKLTVDRAAGRGLWNFGGTVTASDVVLNDSGEFGVTSTYFDGKNGSVTIDNLVINGTTKDNAISANNSTITVTNGQINNAGMNAAIAMFGGKVTLTNVQIKDHTHYGAVASDPGSVVTLNNVSFSGGKRGIVSYHGTINGKDITIDNTSEFSVTSSYEDSVVNLENVNIRDCQGNAAVNVGGTKTKLTNVLISNPAKNGIDVNQNGTLNMAGVTVDNPGGVGINIIGANVLGDNVRIYNAGNYAIYAQKEGNVVGSTKITNLKVDKTVNQAVSCNATVMTLKDVQIENAGKAGEPKCGVYVIRGGKLTLTNAKITNTAYTSVYVENDGASAYLEDIEIYGGQRGIVCYHGRVEGKNVVIQDTTSFSITSSHSDSSINLTNVEIQNCKNDSGAAVNVGGATVTLKDVTVNGAAGHGMAVDGNGQLNLENATIENVTKWCGIYANGGKVTGTNVTVINPNYNGVEVLNDSLVNINGLTVTGAKHNGVLVTKGTFEGKNTSIQDVAWHGIHVSANGIAKVNGAQINNSALNGIFVEGGKITGKTISVNSKAHGLAASGGTVELTELKVVNADRIGANVYNKANVKLSDLIIEKAATHGVNVETGSTVELNKAEISNIVTYNGIYANGGKVTGKDVMIQAPKYNGVEILNSGEVTINGLTVSNAPHNGVLVTKGVADITNATVTGSVWHGIHVSAEGELKLQTADIRNNTLNPIFVEGGKATGSDITVASKVHGLSVSGGNVDFSKLTVTETGANHIGINIYNKATVKLSDLEIQKAGTHGINVETGSAVDLQGAKIKNIGTYNGVYANGGTVTGKNVTITSPKYNGMEVLNNGNVTLDGLTVSGAPRNGVLVTKGIADLKNVNISGCSWHGIHVSAGGELKIEDAKFSAITLNPIFADGGKVTGKNVESTGGHHGFAASNGSVSLTGLKIHTPGHLGISAYGSSVLELSDVQIDGTPEQAVKVYESANVTIRGLTIDNCKSGNAAIYVAATADISDASINNPTGHGVDVQKNGNLKLSDSTFAGAKLNGLFVAGGTLTGNNVTVNSPSYSGLAADGGSVNITGLTVNNAGTNGMKLYNSAMVTVKDLTVTNTVKEHGAYVLGNATLTLDGANITGTKLNPLFAEGGTINGSNVTVTSAAHGLAVSGGKVDLTGLTITQAASQGVNIYNKSTVKLTDLTIGKAGVHGINVEAGSTVELNTASISNITSYNGIYANGGTVTGTDVTITAPKYNGIEVLNGGSVTLDGLTVSGAPRNGVLVTKGTADLKNANITSSNWHGIHVPKDGILKLEKATFDNNALNPIFVEGGNATGSDITVTSKTNGLAVSGGYAEFDGYHILAAPSQGVNFYNGGDGKLSDLTIDRAGIHGINVESGSDVALHTVSIANITSYNGIYANGGTVTGGDVTINAPKYNGIEVLNNGSVTLDGLTVSGAPRNGVLVTKGIADLKNVNISGCSYHGVHVPAGGELKIQGAVFSGITLNPIFVDGGTVTGSDIESSGGYHGLSASNGSATITGLKIQSPAHLGITAYGNSVLNLTDAEIIGTPEQAVKVYEKANVTIDGLKIDNCKSGNAAIYVAAIADISNATITNFNGHGVDVEKGGNLKLSDSTVTGAKLNGLFVAGGTLTGGNITVNTPAYAGLAADAGTVNLNGLTVTNAGTNGLKLYNSANVTVSNLTVTNTAKEHGAYVLGNATLTINTGNITGTNLNGIFAEGGTVNGSNVTVSAKAHGLAVSGGKADISKLTVNATGTTRMAVNAYGKSTVKLTDLTVNYAGFHGINVETGAVVDVQGATIQNVASYNGIYANGGTVTGKNVTVNSPKYNGVEVLNGGNLTLEGLTVATASRNGVLVTKGTANLKNINLDGNKLNGINVKAEGVLTVDGGTIVNTTDFAIFLEGGNASSVKNLTIQGGKRGIQVNTGSFTGSEIVIRQVANYGMSANGTIQITGLEIYNAGNHAINFNSKAVATLSDFLIDTTGWEAIGIYDTANVTLTDGRIINWKTAAIKTAATASCTQTNIKTS